MELSDYAKYNSASPVAKVSLDNTRDFYFMAVNELALTDCYICTPKPKLEGFDHVVVYEIPYTRHYTSTDWAKSVISYQRYVQIINTDFDLYEESNITRCQEVIKSRCVAFDNGFKSSKNIVIEHPDAAYSAWWIHCFEYMPKADTALDNWVIFQMGIE